MMFIRSYIKDKVMISSNTILVSLQKYDNSQWDYIPGQSAKFILAIDKDDPIMRTYSVCSTNINLLEIAVAIVGKGSMYLRDTNKEACILVGHFMGDFVYKPAKYTTFIATGTGMSPFRSMLYQNVLSCNICEKINIIHGARDRSTLIWKKDMMEIKDPRINYTACLSREESNSQPLEFKGRVTDYIKNIDLVNHNVYLCGNGMMISDVITLLKDKVKNIYTKRYF